MSATAVISLSPTCRCFTSVGDRFPEILFIMFQTLLMEEADKNWIMIRMVGG